MSRTLTKSKGGSAPAAGWHAGTVTKCEKGSFSGSNYYDVYLDSLHENMKCRVWEARNSDGEEFSIGNLIRYSNPEILEEISNNGEDAIVKVDDAPNSLIGKRLQVFVYKKTNGYMDVLQNKVAPAEPFENIIDTIDDNRINYIKTAAETYHSNRVSKNGSVASTSSDEGDEIPF